MTTYSATPADFLRVTPNNRLRGRFERGDVPDERTLYPGTATLILAAAAFVPPVAPSAWMYLALTAFSVDAALGMNGILFPLLHQVAPPLTSLRAPARFGALVLLSLSVLAGYGVAKIIAARPRTATALAVVATIWCVAEFWSAPMGTRLNQEPPTEAHRWLSSQPPGTVVLELPVPTNDALWLYETTYVIRSTHHWQPLVNGYSGFAPGEYIQTLDHLRDFPDQRSIERLRVLGVRFVLLNRVYYTGEEFTGLISGVTRSPAFWPPRSFGDGDNQIVIVELKAATPAD